MNKNVLKIFLTEDLNSEQLDEALPKDLAVAYNNSGVDSKSRSKGYYTGPIDWQNTDYIEINPEEGKEIWKNDPTKLILIITDYMGKDRVVKFREDGKVNIDPKFGNYRFDLPRDKAYIKRDGTVVTDVFKAKINHLLSIAKKIYRTNEGEVTRDQAVKDLRATNPESPNYKDVTGAKRELINKYKNENSEALNLLSTLKDFQRARKDPVDISKIGRIKYLDDTHEVVWDSSYGGRGDSNYWLEKFKDYFKRWSGADGDTFVAWLCYLLALDGPNFTYRLPTEKDIRQWYNLKDVTSNFKADLRYLDVATILQEPKKALAQSLDKAHVLKNKIEYTQQDRDRFNSPEARSSREADITYYIQRYKERLMDAINNLEKYEAKLDDLDAEDAKKIKEYDDEINNINNELAKALSSFNDMKANGAYTNSPFGRKVPESLEEEKSLDELVDVLINRKNESAGQDLTEAYENDEERLQALAEYLDIDPNEIENESPEFITPEGDYLVLTDEEAHDRAVDEVKMLFDDMGLESFTPQFQQQIVNEFMNDEVVDDFINQEIEYFENEEGDAEMLAYLQGLNTKEEKIDYIKEVFGDLKDFVKPEDIDIDAVAEEAINQDGIAHFIAYYDGEENELGNGYLAYRIN